MRNGRKQYFSNSTVTCKLLRYRKRDIFKVLYVINLLTALQFFMWARFSILVLKFLIKSKQSVMILLPYSMRISRRVFFRILSTSDC